MQPDGGVRDVEAGPEVRPLEIDVDQEDGTALGDRRSQGAEVGVRISAIARDDQPRVVAQLQARRLETGGPALVEVQVLQRNASRRGEVAHRQVLDSRLAVESDEAQRLVDQLDVRRNHPDIDQQRVAVGGSIDRNLEAREVRPDRRRTHHVLGGARRRSESARNQRQRPHGGPGQPREFSSGQCGHSTRHRVSSRLRSTRFSAGHSNPADTRSARRRGAHRLRPRPRAERAEVARAGAAGRRDLDADAALSVSDQEVDLVPSLLRPAGELRLRSAGGEQSGEVLCDVGLEQRAAQRLRPRCVVDIGLHEPAEARVRSWASAVDIACRVAAKTYGVPCAFDTTPHFVHRGAVAWFDVPEVPFGKGAVS